MNPATKRISSIAAGALLAGVLASCSPGPGKFNPAECGRTRIARTDVVALTDDGRLACVEGAKADKVRVIGSLTGLDNETLVGIDFRSPFTDAMGVSNNVPVEGNLYGLGSNGGIYQINAETAVATKKSQLSVALTGAAFGIDFNPTVDRLRVVSDSGQNLRVNVDTGVAIVDGTLNRAGVTAVGIGGAAYTNVDSDPATGTNLYNIDTAVDQLVVQNPPNDGGIVAIGAPLGVDASNPVGFDLYSQVVDKGNKVLTTTNVEGYAVLSVDGARVLYRVTPFSGRVTSIGTMSLPVADIAIPLAQ